MEQLILFDVEQQKHITFSVTHEDFKEITENDNLNLATTLLGKHQNQIKEKENFVAAFKLLQKSSIPSVSVSTNSHFASDANDSSTSESQSSVATVASKTFEFVNTEDISFESITEASENSKLWNDDSIKYLISLCKKYDKDFSSGIKKYIWGKIAKELSEKFGQQYSTQQCDTKWKGLKNTYKTVKKHNDQSGNNFKFWKYYDLLDEILFSKPEINVTATCSSAKGLIIRSPNTLNTEQNDNNNLNEDPNDSTIATPRNYTSSFMRKREATENAVERRHQEKLARQDRFLDLLGRLTTAVEDSIHQNQNVGDN